MFKNTTHALASSLTTSQLILLHKDSLNWTNPLLLSITQKELIKRDEKSALRDHWAAFLKKNELRTDGELAKVFMESADELSGILFFRILKRRIEEADPNSPYVCFADASGARYGDRIADDKSKVDDTDLDRESKGERQLYKLDLTHNFLGKHIPSFS